MSFIFLTQIYYSMNFITSLSISSQDFPGTLSSIFADCFWRTFFLCSTQKMRISEYVCKTCLKELGILLKCREIFEKFLGACNCSKNTGLPQFFTKVSDNCILRTKNKNQKVAIMLTFLNSKLTKIAGKDKQNHIFYKRKSYEILYILYTYT